MRLFIVQQWEGLQAAGAVSLQGPPAHEIFLLRVLPKDCSNQGGHELETLLLMGSCYHLAHSAQVGLWGSKHPKPHHNR